MFQHRHYVKLAEIIASFDVPQVDRMKIADHFADELRGTNSNFDRERFYAAAIGRPINGRDKSR